MMFFYNYSRIILNVNTTPVQEEMHSIYTFSKQWRCPVSQAAERIVNGELDGFIFDASALETETSKRGDCELLKVHKLGLSLGWAFAFPRGSPYRQSMDKAIYELQGQGTLWELRDRRRAPSCPGKSIPANKDMTVYFLLFAVLLVLTLALLLAECVVYKCRRRPYIFV